MRFSNPYKAHRQAANSEQHVQPCESRVTVKASHTSVGLSTEAKIQVKVPIYRGQGLNYSPENYEKNLIIRSSYVE